MTDHLGRKRPCLFGPRYPGMSVHMDMIRLVQVHGIGFFYVKKLWLLFSPETTADILGLHDRHWQSAREEVIEQMRALYPTIKCNSWPQDCQPLGVFQYPGDVVYGRSGWWQFKLWKLIKELNLEHLKRPCSVYLTWSFWFNGKINKIFRGHDFQRLPQIIAPFLYERQKESPTAIIRGNTISCGKCCVSLSCPWG